MKVFLPLALTLAAWPAAAQAQLPPSIPLTDTDRPLFQAEIARVEKLLQSSPDKATVTYQMARTYAFGKQWPETIQWLRKTAQMKAGLDPGRDSVFKELKNTRELRDILATVREATPARFTQHPGLPHPRGRSRPRERRLRSEP